jgi:hypothetical protein
MIAPTLRKISSINSPFGSQPIRFGENGHLERWRSMLALEQPKGKSPGERLQDRG